MRRKSHQSAAGVGLNIQQTAVRAGLTPALALDAGWPASYASGQTWSDISGNSRDFLLGADINASTDDPTFNNGAVLSKGRYFALDGGDSFAKASANDAYFNGLHKDAAAWGLFAAVYIPDLAAQGRFFATKAAATTSIGVLVAINASETIQVGISNGSANTNFTSSGSLVPNAWNVFGHSVTVNGSAFHFRNGVVETFTATVSSPSASDAAQTARIGADGLGVAPMPNGTRLGALAMFSTAPSQAQMQAMFGGLRTRYGR